MITAYEVSKNPGAVQIISKLREAEVHLAQGETVGQVARGPRNPGSTEPATRFGCRDTQTGAPLKLG